MPHPGCAGHSELVIKKSRFIGCVQPWPTARAHRPPWMPCGSSIPCRAHLLALLAGGQSAVLDDGEPAGLPAVPCLTVAPPGPGRRAGHGWCGTWRREAGCRGPCAGLHRRGGAALLTAPKVALQRMKTLQGHVPYALEGLFAPRDRRGRRRSGEVQHGTLVTLQFCLPEAQAAAFIERITTPARAAWAGPNLGLEGCGCRAHTSP